MASETIASLAVNLTLESAKYTAGLKNASKGAKSWAAKTRSTVNAAGKAFIGLGASAAAGFAVIFKQTSKSADELAKTADKLGLNTSKLAGLRHAAELTGVSQQKLDKSMERMVRRLAEAANGGGEAAETIEQLGLNADELANMAPDEAFSKVADAMKVVKSQSEKVRAAYNIFGREGIALVNTLDLGSDGLAKMQQEAETLGIAMTRVDAAKIEAANDSFTRVNAVFKGVGNTITAETAPIIEAMANAFVDTANEAGGMSQFVLSGMESIVKGVGHAANAVKGLTLVWPGIKTAAVVAFDVILQGLVKLDESITGFLNKIPGVTAETSAGLAEASRILGEMRADSVSAFEEMVLQELPSEKVTRFFNKLRADAQKKAEEVAAQKGPIKFPIDPVKGKTGTGLVDTKGQDELEKIRQSLLTEEEALQESYQRRLEIIRTNTMEGGKIRRELTERLDRDHNEAMVELHHKQLDQRLEGTRTFLGSLTALQQSGSKKLQAVGQAAAITTATIDGIVAVQKALASAPPPVNFISAAAVGAATAANVAKIAGIAHGGLDFVPRESTYMLDRGERVLSPEQNKDITQFVKEGGGDSRPVNIIIHEAPPGTEVQQSGDDYHIILRRIEDGLIQNVQRGRGLANHLKRINEGSI